MSSVTEVSATRARGLRANALAATVMLLVQYGLGTWVALYAAVPAGDQGKSTFTAFTAAVAHGPLALSLHAVLGTLLLVTATAAVVRSVLLSGRPATVLTSIGLLSIVVAWADGSRFVVVHDGDRDRRGTPRLRPGHLHDWFAMMAW
jgi:hypothetical protein